LSNFSIEEYHFLANGRNPSRHREEAMKRWKKPVVLEISVGMEINAYACAGM
jgi:coenzyme PQQ precursor peptide PqqA